MRGKFNLEVGFPPVNGTPAAGFVRFADRSCRPRGRFRQAQRLGVRRRQSCLPEDTRCVAMNPGDRGGRWGLLLRGAASGKMDSAV